MQICSARDRQALISPRTSGNYKFRARKKKPKSIQVSHSSVAWQLRFGLCVIPKLVLLHTERRRLTADPFLYRTLREEQTGAHSGPLPATEDLLISFPGCGLTAGNGFATAVGSGVRARAHFTCGWMRISICSASTPHHAAALPALPHAVYM